MIFLGTLGGLTYCHHACDNTAETEVQTKTDYYATQADCQRDWGTEGANCQPLQDERHQPALGSATRSDSGGSLAATNTHGEKGYTYAGPRYYWYRTENGGYPMAIDPDGTTRPISASPMTESGSKYASQSISTSISLPKNKTASEGVLRRGFGQIPCSVGLAAHRYKLGGAQIRSNNRWILLGIRAPGSFSVLGRIAFALLMLVWLSIFFGATVIPVFVAKALGLSEDAPSIEYAIYANMLVAAIAFIFGPAIWRKLAL